MPRIEIEGSAFNVTEAHAPFWDLIRSGRWEQATFRAIASQLRANTVFFDFGTWIGPISLFAATRAARVYSFEPDPVAAQAFRDNVACNPALAEKITPFERAIWPTPGVLKLGAKRAQGDSMSSVMHTGSSTTWDVPVTTPGDIEALIEPDAPIFLKIDVEGAEYEVIPALGKILSRPDVSALVSFHPRFAAGNHFRWHRTFPMTHRCFRMFRGFKVYRVHKNSFRRAPVVELLTWLSLPVFETRITYLFVKSASA